MPEAWTLAYFVRSYFAGLVMLAVAISGIANAPHGRTVLQIAVTSDTEDLDDEARSRRRLGLEPGRQPGFGTALLELHAGAAAGSNETLIRRGEASLS